MHKDGKSKILFAVHPEQITDNSKMTAATDRKKFRQALNHS
jgi:hypothetical protein